MTCHTLSTELADIANEVKEFITRHSLGDTGARAGPARAMAGTLRFCEDLGIDGNDARALSEWITWKYGIEAPDPVLSNILLEGTIDTVSAHIRTRVM